ncbi:MAG: carboxypeptidase-like regulatory domain-containing protein [Chitinophagaceae bacterium]
MQKKNILLFSLLLFCLYNLQAQNTVVTISGIVKSKVDKNILPYVNIVLKTEKDSAFVTGTVSNEEGRFTISNIKSGSYILQFSYTGFEIKLQQILVGSLSLFLDIGTIELQQNAQQLNDVVVTCEARKCEQQNGEKNVFNCCKH